MASGAAAQMKILHIAFDSVSWGLFLCCYELFGVCVFITVFACLSWEAQSSAHRIAGQDMMLPRRWVFHTLCTLSGIAKKPVIACGQMTTERQRAID